MLWLFVIFLIGGLSFVLFHKPHVNSAGAAWTPPAPRSTFVASTAEATEDAVTLRLQREAAGGETAEDAVTLRLQREPATRTPDTFDFNDLFGGRRPDPSERPRV
jgi:hypothetical protein